MGCCLVNIPQLSQASGGKIIYCFPLKLSTILRRQKRKCCSNRKLNLKFQIYTMILMLFYTFWSKIQDYDVAYGLTLRLVSLQSFLFLMQEFDEVMKERRQSPSEEDLVEKIATNPIHAYKMMKRFTVDWKSLQVSESKKHIFFCETWA